MAEDAAHEVGNDTAGATAGTSGPPPAPPLPARLNDLRPPMLVGTVIWLVAFAVLLFTDPDTPLFWITLAGWLLGLAGLSVSAWQRWASRRGSRGAQTGV